MNTLLDGSVSPVPFAEGKVARIVEFGKALQDEEETGGEQVVAGIPGKFWVGFTGTEKDKKKMTKNGIHTEQILNQHF